MAGTTAPVGLPIVVTGGDRATVELQKISRGIQNLDKSFGSLGARIKSGLQWHLVYNGIRLIERSITSLLTAIPDLIGKGQRWAAVVDDMSDATGMNARQSSELAAVQMMLGGSTESLGKAMVQLAKNARMHENVLKEMGVATRNTHGGFLGIYQILQNLRNAYSETTDGATRFGRAYQQLGRGTREVTDLLSLNAGQYAVLAAQAQRSGLIMDETMARNAETLKRTQGILDATITGVGNQILGGVAPVLTALVNGISQVIQDNLTNIVRFAVMVVNTIAGLVSGLFGLDLSLITIAGQLSLTGDKGKKGADGLDKFGDAAKNAATGASAAEKAIQRQIDAIDRQLKMMDRHERREDAKAEHAKLLKDVRDAKAELGEIKSQSIFAAGMSDAEAELARQALAANVVDGIKNVKDAEEALRRWKRDKERDHQRAMLQMQREALQEQLAAQKAASTAMVAAARTGGIKMGTGLAAGLKPLSKEMKRQRTELMQLGRDSIATGKEMAASIKDFIFGPEEYTGRNQLGQPGGTPTRSGGVAGFLNDISTLGGFLKDNTLALKALAAAFIGYKVVQGVGSLATTLGGLLSGVGGLSGLVGLLGGAGAGLLGQDAINQEDRRDGPVYDLFKYLNSSAGRNYDADLTRRDGKHPGQGTLEYLGDLEGTLKWWSEALRGPTGPGQDADNPKIKNDLLSDIAADYSGRTPQEAAQLALLQHGQRTRGAMAGGQSGSSGFMGGGGMLGTLGMGGLSGAMAVTGGLDILGDLGLMVRRYLGDGSPTLEAQRDMGSAMDWVVSNTQPLADGTVSTKIGEWVPGVQGNVLVAGGSVSVAGSVGILNTANSVKVASGSVGVTGSVGILDTSNSVQVASGAVTVSGSVGLLKTGNTVNVGTPTISLAKNSSVGILDSSNTINLGSVGDVTIKVAGGVITTASEKDKTMWQGWTDAFKTELNATSAVARSAMTQIGSLQDAVYGYRDKDGKYIDGIKKNLDQLDARVTAIRAAQTVNNIVQQNQIDGLDTRVGAIKSRLDTVRTTQRGINNDVQKALYRLETKVFGYSGRGSNPTPLAAPGVLTMGSGSGSGSASPAMNITLTLDATQTRALLGGRDVTSTTRAVPGI